MVEGSKVILCYMVTGKYMYISVIAKVYIQKNKGNSQAI